MSNSSNQNNKTENNGINPFIEIMINIYIFKDEMKTKINKLLSQSMENKYYCIRKKWVDKFK